jgi:hypothetical protein
VISPENLHINRRSGKSSRLVYSPDGVMDTLDIMWANVAPFDLVRVEQVPISHPRDIPGILGELRRYALLETLWSSLVKASGNAQIEHHGASDEISFADVIVDFDKIDRSDKPADVRLLFLHDPESGPLLELSRFGMTVTININCNSKVSVTATDQQLEAKLQRAIEVTEDLGVVSELFKRL